MKKHLVISLSLISIFSTIAYFNNLFLIPLSFSIVSYLFIFYFSLNIENDFQIYDDRIKNLENELNNLKLSIKLKDNKKLYH